MLPGIAACLGGLARGGGPVVITQTAAPAAVAESGGTATYSSQSIGAAADDRIVCLLVTSAVLNGSITAATIDYGTGPQAMSATTQGNNTNQYARLFYLAAPTGTTATFVVSIGGLDVSANNGVSIYSVTGADPTPAASGSDDSTDMDSTDPLTTGSITIPTNGGFLAVANGSTSANAKTWANATEDIDKTISDHRHTTATRTTAGTVAVTCQGTDNGENGALAWIVFNPS